MVDKSVGRSKLVVVEDRGFLDSVLRAAMGSVVTEDEMGLSLGGGAVLLLGDALALVGMGLTM